MRYVGGALVRSLLTTYFFTSDDPFGDRQDLTNNNNSCHNGLLLTVHKIATCLGKVILISDLVLAILVVIIKAQVVCAVEEIKA
ncbi:7509_t:CDS:2 [Paraglomus occultum]|uniref:7509_t:CDS:1 n=1 Tax=Paraglomus occultum TaxID=144539 RepID=A0A9N8ZIF1_9GLOM|nr:7509_t:CDS:2 [Paraglomus occultum]